MNSPSALALLQEQDTLTALHKLASNYRRFLFLLMFLLMVLLAPAVTIAQTSPKAKQIVPDTSSFDGLLSAADDTVQKALDTLDDITFPVTFAVTNSPSASWTELFPGVWSVDVLDSTKWNGYTIVNEDKTGLVLRHAGPGLGGTQNTEWVNIDSLITLFTGHSTTGSVTSTVADTNKFLRGDGTWADVGVKVAVPATPTSSGLPGWWAVSSDTNLFYICVMTNVWRRHTISTW